MNSNFSRIEKETSWLDSGEGGAREKMFEMLDTL